MDVATIALFMTLIFFVSWIFVFLAIYFTPVLIAYIRRHNNILAILILTIFLGWTFFGWLAATLWALNSDVSKEEED